MAAVLLNLYASGLDEDLHGQFANEGDLVHRDDVAGKRSEHERAIMQGFHRASQRGLVHFVHWFQIWSGRTRSGSGVKPGRFGVCP